MDFESYRDLIIQNPHAGVLQALSDVFDAIESLDSKIGGLEEFNKDDFFNLRKTALFLDATSAHFGLDFPRFDQVNKNLSRNAYCDLIVRKLHTLDASLVEILKEEELEVARVSYSSLYQKQFHYEFAEGDIQTVQSLLNDLRDLITASEGLEDEHKQRILTRLEKLQSELHKKVSDLDRFWGLVGDAGVMAKKLGNDAKPIVDRIKELSNIVWKTQSKAEELPDDSQNPLLEND